MGNHFTRSPPKHKLLVLGLPGAGKTQLFMELKMGEVVTERPTLFLSIHTVQYKSLTFHSWSLENTTQKFGEILSKYYRGADAIIFMVDSNDDRRLDKEEVNAAEELAMLLRIDELKDAILLIFANKQDLPGALPVTEITQRLKVAELCGEGRKWHVQPCIAHNRDGVYEGLDWLDQTLSKS